MAAWTQNPTKGPKSWFCHNPQKSKTKLFLFTSQQENNIIN